MISTELFCDEPLHSVIGLEQVVVVVLVMLGLLSLSPLSLSAPIVVESRSTALKDRFREPVREDQARNEMVVETTPIEMEHDENETLVHKYKYIVTIYSQHFNILRIASGMAGLGFHK